MSILLDVGKCSQIDISSNNLDVIWVVYVHRFQYLIDSVRLMQSRPVRLFIYFVLMSRDDCHKSSQTIKTTTAKIVH